MDGGGVSADERNIVQTEPTGYSESGWGVDRMLTTLKQFFLFCFLCPATTTGIFIYLFIFSNNHWNVVSPLRIGQEIGRIISSLRVGK